jgi:hypothetical protein
VTWSKGLKALPPCCRGGCVITSSLRWCITGANGDTGPGMGAIGRLQVVVRCEHVAHCSLCTLERQSLCASHRQRRWLTCWSYVKALASQASVWPRCLAHLLLPLPCKGVHRARLIPRSRGLLVTACLSCDPPLRQSQDKHEEASHGNRHAGDR